MLTDRACRNATCPANKPRARFADSGGLYLEVAANGSKRWFAKYRFGGKEKRLALGSYPAVSLKEARDGRDAARKTREQGADPVQARQIAKAIKTASAAVTFEAVAREYHAAKAEGWSATHARQWLRCCEKDLFPWVGSLPLAEVTAPVLLSTLRRVEARGATQLVRDLCEFAGQVFRYGIQSGKTIANPAADLKGAFKHHTVRHAAALVEPVRVGELLRAIEGYAGQPATRAALELSALIFQRPGNVRAMEWAWIDLDAAMLTIPADSMKRVKAGKINGRPHFVPLAPRAVELLKDVQSLTGHGRFVFPSNRGEGRCMSENTIAGALLGMGFAREQMSAHGFRAMARTLIVERLPGVSPDVIEAQLAHGKAGPLGMAYDRAEFMEQRRALMKAWADYLDQLKAGAKVIEFKAA
ncbi:integrase arm-type DNA-binding domain-containing protein [Pelomonas sp. Root1444]|uniref:tyrosine-type recombinase/integrase n=1 Tax=Pelomonas sp. Root1444 TaxID=1736464 RepID=UPI000703213C|nr:integrase arm-type DNA-binding domain-containing protein [Pelomonas sp. Root1444]KQY81805.1 integrase [Pelomonas sp. Root1444]